MLSAVISLGFWCPPIDTGALHTFVPQYHKIISITEGDLNHDGRKDVIMITSNDHLSTTERDSNEALRSFIILILNSNNCLEHALTHNNMILCRECGGAFGDPFAGIVIRENSFSVYHYGGSAHRWSIENVFKWSAQDKTWFFEKTVHSNHFIYEPEMPETGETVLPESPVSIINFGLHD